ncbi:MAG TPA: flagellar protein FlaG [Steroidobacteraceae bacterium]|nr:flagellar protein FlaG [Steroidobacteraceae bacterium]
MNLGTVVQTAKQQSQPQVAADTAIAGQASQTAGPSVPAMPAMPEAVVARKAEPVEPPAEDAVKAAAAQIESYLKSVGRNLDIYVDRDTGKTIVTVRDAATGDVIRQIPGDETLRLARSLGDHASALIDLSA